MTNQDAVELFILLFSWFLLQETSVMNVEYIYFFVYSVSNVVKIFR